MIRTLGFPTIVLLSLLLVPVSAQEADVVIEHLAEPRAGSAAFFHPAEVPTVRVVTGGMLRAATGSMALASAKAEAWGLSAAAVGYEDLAALGDSVPDGPFLAANVRHSRTGNTPFAGHVLRDVGGTRIAFVGITQAPPHAATRVDLGAWELLDPAEVLAGLLEELAGHADLVLLLAAMDRIECARLLRAVPGVHAALVASETASDYEALAVGASYLITSPVASESLARLTLVRDGTGWRPGSNTILEPRLDSADAARIREVHGATEGPSATASLFPGSPIAEQPGVALPDRIELGQNVALSVTAMNRGAELTLSSMRLLSSYGGREAPAGHTWLVLHGTWRNVIPLAFAFERELPVTYAILEPRDHFYVVVDGCRLGRLDSTLTGGPGGVADGALVLPRLGSVRSGNLVFALPLTEPPQSLELRFYDYAHGHMRQPLLTGEAPRSEPRDEPRQNKVLEAGIYGFEKTATIGSRTAPAGMTFVVVDLRARSQFTYESDATAFDPKAKAGETIQIGTVADWNETERYLQAVVDGEFAYGLEPETTLSALPRFLPDTITGERAVFLVPREYTSLELRCDFPNAAPPSGEVFHPAPLLFALEGERPPRPAREALLDIVDEGYAGTTITSAEARASFAGEAAGAERKFFVLDLHVRSLSDKGELYQTPQHLRYVAADGSQLALDEISGRGPYRTTDVLYVPHGEVRSFQAAFRIPASEAKPRLAYHGVTMAEVFDLPPLAETVPAADPVASTDPASVTDPPPDTTPLKTPERPDDLPVLEGGALAGFAPVALQGAGVELSVLDARLSAKCRDRDAEEGRRFLLLQLLWRRLDLSQRWRSGYLSDKLFLLRGGFVLERVWGRSWGAEGFLPASIALDEENTFACTVAFDVPAGESLAGSSLVYVPLEDPPLVLLFGGASSDPPLPVLAFAENEILEFAVHDFVEPSAELVERIGSNMPKGQELVCLRVSAASKERPLQLSRLEQYLQLVAAGSFPCPSFFGAGSSISVLGWPMWTREMLFLPGVRRHGVLAYAVPRRDAAFTLELHLPEVNDFGGQPLASPLLELPLTRGEPRPDAPVLAHLEENGWEIDVLGLRRHGNWKNPEVVMDVRVQTSLTGRNVVFERAMFNITDHVGKTQYWASYQVHPYESASRFHSEAGRPRRFDVGFRLTDPGTHLWLRVPKLCPTHLVQLRNPWVPAERDLLAANEPLGVTTAEEPEIAHAPPALFPEPEPLGIEGVGLTGNQVNEAIRRGARFLMEKHAKGFRDLDEEHILVILALLHSGEIQKDPALMADAIRCAEQRPLGTIYDAALTLMTLAWLDPDRYRPRIERIAQALIDAQRTDGAWSYAREYVRAVEPLVPVAPEGEETEEAAPRPRIELQGGGPIPGWPGTEEKKDELVLSPVNPNEGTGGDHSCSQYAVLGLQAAFNCGVHASPETWEKAVKRCLEGQDPGRGWGYSLRNHSTGSMTTAGLAALSVASFHLGERPEHVEASLGAGVDWIARNFQVDANPRNESWQYYYLYGLERAGRLLGKEFFGPHEWYPLGARYLVDNQSTAGSWSDAQGYEIRDTAFALLFLTLATEELGAEKEEPPTGPGTLTVLTPGTGGSVVFILDASGSMGAEFGDETRFDAARRVVLEVLRSAGPELEVALRVYGHRYRSIDERANEDSELVMGFGPADRPELAAQLSALRFRGKTPLTFSLMRSFDDLRTAGSDTPRVVLLTDGAESDRSAKPVEAAEALRAAGVRLDVVCLAMDNTALLARMAAAGGGACYSAKDGEQLLGAIRTTVIGTVPFRVLDAEAKQVAAGESGTDVTLPAGPYTVEVDLPDGTETVPAWVHQDRTTRITVRAQ